MGDGAYDAETAEELRGVSAKLRKMLGHVYTGHIIWVARNGRKTALGKMSLKRLKNLENFLIRTKEHKDNKDWLKIIQNEIKNRG